MPRYIRNPQANAIAKTRKMALEANKPTGTEKSRTREVAAEAGVTADFAKQLAQQLELELGPLPGQIQEALDDVAAALSEAGLARSEAAAAVSAAQDAVADAATAISEAQAAAEAAADAQTAADGKSTVVRSTSPATGAGSYQQGDQWWQFSGANIVGLWLHDGAAWVSQALTNAIIATLDAGKITTGTLAADRIGALSITAAKIAAEAITTEKIAALAVTASELAANSVVATKIAANAVVAEKIAAGAVTTVKLDALAVTAEKITAGAIIAEKIAAGAITTAKLAATAIDGMTITGAIIRTAASGQRLQIDASGLRAYNSSGQNVATISSFGDGIKVDSVLSEYAQGTAEITGRSVAMRSKAAPYDRYMMFDYPPADDYSPALIARGIANGQKHRLWMRLIPWGSNSTRWYFDTDRPDGPGNSPVYFSKQLIAAQLNESRDRDTDLVNNTIPGAGLGSGWLHLSGAPYVGLQCTIKNGMVIISGAITRASGAYPANAVLFSVPAAYAPEGAAVQYCYNAQGHTFVVMQPNGQCIIAHGASGGNAYFGVSWPLKPYWEQT